MIRKQSGLGCADSCVEKFVWEEPKDVDDVARFEVDKSVVNIHSLPSFCYLTSTIVLLHSSQRRAPRAPPARIRRSLQELHDRALPRRL